MIRNVFYAVTHTQYVFLQEYYSTLAGAIVAGQNDPQNQTRMAEAFSKLTPPSLHLVFFPEDKGEFQRNLREFLSFVKGFLYYR